MFTQEDNPGPILPSVPDVAGWGGTRRLFREIEPGIPEAKDLAADIRAHSYDEVHRMIDEDGNFASDE